MTTIDTFDIQRDPKSRTEKRIIPVLDQLASEGWLFINRFVGMNDRVAVSQRPDFTIHDADTEPRRFLWCEVVSPIAQQILALAGEDTDGRYGSEAHKARGWIDRQARNTAMTEPAVVAGVPIARFQSVAGNEPVDNYRALRWHCYGFTVDLDEGKWGADAVDVDSTRERLTLKNLLCRIETHRPFTSIEAIPADLARAELDEKIGRLERERDRLAARVVGLDGEIEELTADRDAIQTTNETAS